MNYDVEIQRVVDGDEIPRDADLNIWALAALAGYPQAVSVVLRITDSDESRTLNRDYRGKDLPTNVLSFPFEAPPGVPDSHLGDLVICAEVVVAEATAQAKVPAAHWAHMVVHGVLHLRGYDHLDDVEADIMEGREREILATLGFPDPYLDDMTL